MGIAGTAALPRLSQTHVPARKKSDRPLLGIRRQMLIACSEEKSAANPLAPGYRAPLRPLHLLQRTLKFEGTVLPPFATGMM